MIKVFFDNNCPVCRREVSLYKKLSDKKDIKWYDVTSNNQYLKEINKTKKECLKVLHVIDNNGNIQTAVDAFIVIWSECRYFKLMVFIFKTPYLKQLADYLYKLYANYRYNKLYCRD